MSCSDGGSRGLERYPGTGCCGTSCAAEQSGCQASEPRIRSCFCRENVGCVDRADCGGFRPSGTAATGACPGPCQCAEEEAWNLNAPPKPNCEWLANFSELRRQWSDHGRQNNCQCCNCKPCRKAAPCKPCFPVAPESSRMAPAQDNCQACCSDRLSGGANGKSSCCQRDVSPSSALRSSGGCSSASYGNGASSRCGSPSNANSYPSSPCDTPSETELSTLSPSCRPPSSCQPCSPSQKPTLNKRSCCQCIPGYCMCQPMPRTCNCPPPVQVDARAGRECECECPSSPECACPPSERKFAQSTVKCPNARLCCSSPRPQPGPKCNCTKCQPCLPPPCDPCTSSKCRTVTPKIKPCAGETQCEENSPCRFEAPRVTNCRPTPPCKECQKMAAPCRSPSSLLGSFRQGLRQIRPHGRSHSPDSCLATSTPTHNRSDKGHGDNNGEANTDSRASQCHCGSSGSRGCDELCDYCCSHECNDADEEEARLGQNQCSCGGGSNNDEDSSCHQNCDYCCSLNCDSQSPRQAEHTKPSEETKKHVRMMGGAGTDEDKPLSEKTNRPVLPRSMVSNEEMLCDQTVESYEESIAGPLREILSTSVEKTNPTLSLKGNSRSVRAEVIKAALGCNSRIAEGPVLSAVANVCDGVCCLGRGQLTTSSHPSYSSVLDSASTRQAECSTTCTNDCNERSNYSRDIYACLGKIARMILVPDHLTLVSFVLLILVGLTGAFGLALHRRCKYNKKMCKRL